VYPPAQAPGSNILLKTNKTVRLDGGGGLATLVSFRKIKVQMKFAGEVIQFTSNKANKIFTYLHKKNVRLQLETFQTLFKPTTT